MTDRTVSPVRTPAAIRALRLEQWLKNLLVLVPAVGAHRLLDPAVLWRSALAFVAFGLVASGLYVVNDLRDLEWDRRHPRKRLRPIASGERLRPPPRVLVPTLVAAGLALGWTISAAFALLLAGYGAAFVAYTFALKRYVLADVLALAGLYTLRVYGGGLATGIAITDWLATFAMFLFFSLALVKRVSELVETGEPLEGRGYGPADKEPILAMGTAAAAAAVLVLARYIGSPEVYAYYDHPQRLWTLCPLLLYSLGRLWILAWRGAVTDDPVTFALEDRANWIVGALGAGVLWLAS